MTVAFEHNENDSSGVVSALKSLLKLNEGRVKVYENALSGTSDESLRYVLMRYRAQGISFVNTLTIWISSYGLEGFSERRTLSAGRRLWQKIISLFPASGRDDILSECEKKEAMAMRIYRRTLALQQLPYEAYVEIKRQKEHVDKVFRELISLSVFDVLYQ